MGHRAALVQGDHCADLSAGFPAFCHFCLSHGASSAHVSPGFSLPFSLWPPLH